MIQKPKHWASPHGEVFQDQSIAEVYHLRPTYPDEVFDILTKLIDTEPRHVLDVGCGTGFIARNLVERVERVDAVDFSWNMMENGKTLPNGNHPRLRWLYGAVEEVELEPPYALVTAGESLHWMDWNIVLPRFQQVLAPGGYLAVMEHDLEPDTWSMLRETLQRYSTNKDFQPYDMMEVLQRHGLFEKIGEQMTARVPFTQSIDDFIESYHARQGFSRERMGPEQAAAFDEEARKILLKAYPDGVLSFQVAASVVWGLPLQSC